MAKVTGIVFTVLGPVGVSRPPYGSFAGKEETDEIFSGVVVLAMIDNVTNALSAVIDSDENVVSAAIELNTVVLSIIDTVENAFDTPIDDDENVLDGT